MAAPGGECAPAASSGFDVAGVIGICAACATYGPGSAHGGMGTGAGTGLPAAFVLFRYVAAVWSIETQSLYSPTLSRHADVAAASAAFALTSSDGGGSFARTDVDKKPMRAKAGRVKAWRMVILSYST